jgi:hypothetical protein
MVEALQVPVPLDHQIACVARELAIRERCYPRWVEAGRMTRRDADRELVQLRAVLATLKGLEG